MKKRSALGRGGSSRDRSLVALHDAVHDGQPEAAAFADCLVVKNGSKMCSRSPRTCRIRCRALRSRRIASHLAGRAGCGRAAARHVATVISMRPGCVGAPARRSYTGSSAPDGSASRRRGSGHIGRVLTVSSIPAGIVARSSCCSSVTSGATATAVRWDSCWRLKAVTRLTRSRARCAAFESPSRCASRDEFPADPRTAGGCCR